ncbi:MAG: twin-arginine translocase subunit TatB [Gammaproteobacteria bacterium]|nr:MAG: twin-arginine translocase subunit TatB [Gammaproteobacteria bacterium]
MFDIGFTEMILIAVVGLIVIGPKRLPETVRFLGYWVGKLRRSVQGARQDMEREFGLDEIRRELYNEELLGRMEDERKQIEKRLGSPSLTPADEPTPANLKIPNEEDFIDDGPSEPLPSDVLPTDETSSEERPREQTVADSPAGAAIDADPASNSKSATETTANKTL